MSIAHHLRFGTHAETKYFLNGYSELYDAIVFNGNMVAYTQAAIAAFIISANQKKFIIDPQTHAFQHDPSYLSSRNSKGEIKPKKSIQQLAEKLGDPILRKLGEGNSVLPSDFDDDLAVRSLAQGTAGFQKGIIDEIKSHDDWEYLKFKLEAVGGEEPKPDGIVAPYFYMTESTVSQWLDINTKLIDATSDYADDYELMAELVVKKDILTNIDLLDKIIDAYKKTKASTVLLWIDALNEVEASRIELEGLKYLCKELSSDKTVVNLYGGYFSALLANKGYLAGVCNGLEYGESRAVVPVGGGIPMSKYYFTPLHFRMRYADLLTIYSRKGWNEHPDIFKDAVCGCELCELGDIEKFGTTNPVRVRRGANIITLNYPTPEAKDLSLRHYLYAKDVEFNSVRTTKYEELKAQLESARDEYSSVVGPELVGHIDKWLTVLDKD